MKKAILDTSAYSHFKRNNPYIRQWIQTTPQLILPVIVLGELWGGFACGQRQEKNLSELQQFLDSPRVSLLSISGETAEHYAVIYAYLRKQGLPIPTNDLWIAALAMQHGLPIFTADVHFQTIPQIICKLIPLSDR